MSPPLRPDRARRGFSLIEVIAAMSVLAILLVIIGQAYTSVNSAWFSGMTSSDQNAGGRAALGYMARELSAAVVDADHPLYIDTEHSNHAKYAGGQDTLFCFATLSNRPRKATAGDPNTHHRQVQIVKYSGSTFSPSGGATDLYDFEFRRLMRANIYGKTRVRDALADSWPPAAGKFQDNSSLLPFIRTFKVQLHVVDLTQTGNPSQAIVPFFNDSRKVYDSRDSSNGLTRFVPAYADLYLEVLGHDHALTAHGMANASEAGPFCDRNVQRFSTRVFFQNALALRQAAQ
jgi:prepilin-type N-terminal cleavage/methylation domain-containing protein